MKNFVSLVYCGLILASCNSHQDASSPAIHANIKIMVGLDLVGASPAFASLISSDGDFTPLTFTGDMNTTGWINSVDLPR